MNAAYLEANFTRVACADELCRLALGTQGQKGQNKAASELQLKGCAVLSQKSLGECTYIFLQSRLGPRPKCIHARFPSRLQPYCVS